jgi:pyruvate, orthophosphate dikinase
MRSTVTYVYAFDHRHGLPFSEVKARIGGKAANLGVMATELGLPVPPAFTITTTACNEYLAHGWPEGLDAEIREHMRRIEEAVGRRFGDPADPLLVSVRSGAPASMPGMMETILNLGLNDATTAGLAASSGHAAFAANCHARFVQMYRQTVGVEAVPDDPWQQLRGAIEAVFLSWNCGKARVYRSREGIPDDLGTGVTVQAMVFGNRGADSGSGVLFTRNPATGEPTIYGDIMFDAQGEDVVAGTHRTEPLSALDERLPAVGRELRGYAARLERHFADLCDIEFTIERGTLWMLQVRVGKRSPQAALRIAVDMAESDGFPLTRAEAVERVAKYLVDPPRTQVGRGADVTALAVGLPASPGVGTGEIAISPDDAVAVAEAGRPVILVRLETSPDDVHGMAKAKGVLTATGGLASHAAVVARGWGIPAVVGAQAVTVHDHAIAIGGRSFAVGDTITIDGSTGEVFAGTVAAPSTVVPEAATLLAWARECGIVIGAAEGDGVDAGAGAGDAAAAAAETREATADDVIRALSIKGYAMPDGLAAALLSTPALVQPRIDELVAAGLVESTAGMFRLAAPGNLRGDALLAADRASWGDAAAVAALDAFLPLDHRMKDIVTAWQMREIDGQQVLNDHADAGYDATVLDRLHALHDDVAAWLRSLGDRLTRLRAYRSRLDRSLQLATGGDPRYVASPRVDSYHGVWFELHEDLIRLAGRTRAEEAAAGRA